MTIRRKLDEVLDDMRQSAVTHFRYEFPKSILIGPYNDEGVAEPGKEKGEGFAIFIGTWRIGWWKTRIEACDVAQSFADALKEYPVPLRKDLE